MSKERVEFTRAQVEYLERMYPEVPGDANTTYAEFLVQAGRRQFIQFLKSRQAKAPLEQ